MVKKRNGYIDIIKFLFAIIIAEFHLGSGLFPGGRLAVDGFFMITGFFMMVSVEKDKSGRGEIGQSTARFMIRKYKSMVLWLVLSIISAFTTYAILYDYTKKDILWHSPLLIFDVFPTNTAGFRGMYVVGISWYLSSMFIALAILYPLTKRFRSNFTLTACPLLAILCYGLLSAQYGHIAVGTTYIPNTLIQTGITRALGAISMGCLIYEINKRIKDKEYTPFAKAVFTVAELLALYIVYDVMHNFPRGRMEYVAIIVIFAFLIIGISGISYTSCLWNPKWTGFFGKASTLIVLNHYCWSTLVKAKMGDCEKYLQIFAYIGMVTVACVGVYLLSLLLTYLGKKIFKKEYWIKQSENEEKAEEKAEDKA